MDDIDIDFDAVGSLLLDDENLASIFESALTDTNFDDDLFEDDEPVATPQPQVLDGAQLEQQLLQQSQQQQQQQQQQQRPQPSQPSQPQQQQPRPPVPNFNWQPPFQSWRWGMPLPSGYPPPPVALQQHMMRLQHMHHMQQMQQMQQRQQQPGKGPPRGTKPGQQQRPPPQQQPQQSSKPQQPSKKNAAAAAAAAAAQEQKEPSNNKGSASWADGANTKDEGEGKEKTAPLSLEEIMKLEEENKGKSFAPQQQPRQQVSNQPRQQAPNQPNQRYQQQQQRQEPKEDSRKALGSFWHGNGPLPRVDETCMMKVHELVGIMKFQMRPLYTNDTFRDDYYFAEANVRQQSRAMNGMPVLPLGSYEGGNNGGVGAASRLGARPGINQPKRIKRKKKKIPGSNRSVSTPVKLSLSGRENISRQRLVEKARKFQQESKALGLYVKGSVRTPRKLMDLGRVQKKVAEVVVNGAASGASGASGATGEEETKSSGAAAPKLMLSSSRWQVRMSIHRCTGLLMNIKTVVDSGSRGKQSMREKAGMIKALARELGITQVRTERKKKEQKEETTDSTVEPTAEPTAAAASSKDVPDAPEAVCDPTVLQAIAATTKGRRMMCRAIPMLNPIQMRALVIASMRILPTLVAQGNPKDIESATTLQLKKEAWWKALLDERISELLMRGYGTAMMPFPADAEPAFDIMPVALSALLDAHDEVALQKLVQTRGGATAIQEFLARGQNFCAPHPDFSKLWGELYQNFVSKVTNKKDEEGKKK